MELLQSVAILLGSAVLCFHVESAASFLLPRRDANTRARHELLLPSTPAAAVATAQSTKRERSVFRGWLQDFFEPGKASESSLSSPSSQRQVQYPEQYPATYQRNEVRLDDDDGMSIAGMVRLLLAQTQLASRPLQVVYEARHDGWKPTAFHRAVDGKGAAVVVGMVASTNNGDNRDHEWVVGGYNPKGWASLGGARPSVAAFLFYETYEENATTISVPATGYLKGGLKKPRHFQKLRKVGGGGLACARDDPDYGASFGPDGLVIGLQPGREQLAQSKLGPYFECGPEDLPSLFSESGGAVQLDNLIVLVGVYEEGEVIPYSGGVLDMTSG